MNTIQQSITRRLAELAEALESAHQAVKRSLKGIEKQPIPPRLRRTKQTQL